MLGFMVLPTPKRRVSEIWHAPCLEEGRSHTGNSAMGIFSRLTDIVNSNINALLDRAEDPEKIIRLIIQEMEDTLVEVRSDTVRIIADRKEAERQLARLTGEADDWQAKAELALSKGRDDLARAALVAKNRIAE